MNIPIDLHLYWMQNRAAKTAQIIFNTDLLLSSEDRGSLHREATYKNTHRKRRTFKRQTKMLHLDHFYARTLCSFHIAPKALTSCVPCFPSSKH